MLTAAAADEELAAAVRGDDAGAQAAIVIVCREPGARAILGRELSKRYGSDYQVVVCDRPADLAAWMRDLAAAGLPVAMVIGGVGTQDRDGIEVLAAVRAIDPTAVRVAAVRWGDWEIGAAYLRGLTPGHDRPLGDMSGAGPGRGVPPLDHRIPAGVGTGQRGGGFEAGAGDRQAMVGAVCGSCVTLFPGTRIPAGFYDAASRARADRCWASSAWNRRILPVVVLRFAAETVRCWSTPPTWRSPTPSA